MAEGIDGKDPELMAPGGSPDTPASGVCGTDVGECTSGVPFRSTGPGSPGDIDIDCGPVSDEPELPIGFRANVCDLVPSVFDSGIDSDCDGIDSDCDGIDSDCDGVVDE